MSEKYSINKQFLIITLFAFSMFTGCCELPDNYRFFYESMLAEDDNVLMCNPSCKDDAMIDAVTKIEWSTKVMYIEQSKTSSPQYYIIKAHGEKLTCCNYDTLIGPMNLEQFKTKIIELKLPGTLTHVSTYTYTPSKYYDYLEDI